ncbi:MAG: hypothetical protein AAFZ52_06770, partial [Bacteroidota bacterium]
MLDSILDAVKGQVSTTIAEKTGLDLGQAEKAIPLAGESITEGITGAISGGNVDGILGMLTSATGGGGNLVENVLYKGIAGNFISKATSSLGLSEGVAGTISSLALPMIMEKIGGATKAAGDTDGIDAGSMMSALGLDSGSLLSGLAGGAAANLLGGDDKKEKGGGLLG